MLNFTDIMFPPSIETEFWKIFSPKEMGEYFRQFFFETRDYYYIYMDRT